MCQNNCNCISDILNVIYLLQKNCSGCGNAIDSCDKPILGEFACSNYNTRPVMLYTCCSNNTPMQMPTTRDAINCSETPADCSSIFRVEKIDDNCCTFRVLADNPDETEQATIPYVATNSFFTMNLNCVCALKCLNDTYIECI